MKQRASNATRRLGASRTERVATLGHATLGPASCLAAGRLVNGSVRAMRTVDNSAIQGQYVTDGVLSVRR